MRVVNLARRPFINRRPVFRFAMLLWVLGVVLLALNTHLYYRHWQSSAEIRRQLAEVDQALAEQVAVVERERQRLERIDLRALNGRVAFLNSLISYRTFPWSALFDDLEEVMPDDVRLVDVQPVVRLANDAERLERRSARRPRAAAGSEQRRRLVQRARENVRDDEGEQPSSAEGGGSDAAAADSSIASSTEDPRDREIEEELAPDEVLLRLTGFAEREELILELVDALYADPSFRRPLLGSESLDRNQGPEASSFNLSVIYLTRVPTPLPEPVVAGSADLEVGAASPETGVPASPAAVTGRTGAGLSRDTAPGRDRRPASRADVSRSGAQAPPQVRSPTAAGVAVPPTGAVPGAPGTAGSAVSALVPGSPQTAPGDAVGDQDDVGGDQDDVGSPRDRNGDVDEDDDSPELREPDASSSPELDRGARLSGRDVFGRLAAVGSEDVPFAGRRPS